MSVTDTRPRSDILSSVDSVCRCACQVFAVGVESTAAKNSNRLKNLLTQPGKTLLAVSWVFSEKGLGGGLCEI
jgi:hypothetical protein